MIRGGLQALPRGQEEAADALGLSYWYKMIFVILPQALKLVIPPMINNFIGLFKTPRLVAIIGLYDFLGAIRAAAQDTQWRVFTIEGLVLCRVRVLRILLWHGQLRALSRGATEYGTPLSNCAGAACAGMGRPWIVLSGSPCFGARVHALNVAFAFGAGIH